MIMKYIGYYRYTFEEDLRMKQRTLKTRLLAMLLVFAMVFGMVPAYGVSAAETVDSLYIHSGLAGDDGQIHVTYTPEETGHYFLVNTTDYPGLSACEDGETPLSEFDFDDEDGWGSVYELEAGKNYCFKICLTRFLPEVSSKC